MHRTQLLLEDWQHSGLKRLARERRESVGALLRQWVTEKLTGQKTAAQSEDPLFQVVGAVKTKHRDPAQEVAAKIDQILYRKDWS